MNVPHRQGVPFSSYFFRSFFLASSLNNICNGIWKSFMVSFIKGFYVDRKMVHSVKLLTAQRELSMILFGLILGYWVLANSQLICGWYAMKTHDSPKKNIIKFDSKQIQMKCSTRCCLSITSSKSLVEKSVFCQFKRPNNQWLDIYLKPYSWPVGLTHVRAC